jgi:hypothetical protein
VAIQMDMLRRYYPRAEGAWVIHSHVVRMPNSTFSQRPGTAGVRLDPHGLDHDHGRRLPERCTGSRRPLPVVAAP